MQPFNTFTGLVVPLDKSNVDTDAIMPKQFLTSIKRTGFGQYLFDSWRYLEQGYPGQDCSNRPLNQEFELNNPIYKNASILLTKENFGCGSSREHAQWGLVDFGIKVIIAPSFAEIFYNNCIKNGLLPITLTEKEVDDLFFAVSKKNGYSITVNLASQELKLPDETRINFVFDKVDKNKLLEGIDDITFTLKKQQQILDYEEKHKQEYPWLYC